MSIRDRLEADMKEALKQQAAERLGCIRMLRSQLQAREVALRVERGRDYRIDDEQAIAVITSYAKQRRDSIEGYRQGGREEQAAAEERELAIVLGYLPQQLPDDELRQIVRQVVAETGATSIRDLGAVMRLVLSRVQGRADGKRVSQLVRETLGPA